MNVSRLSLLALSLVAVATGGGSRSLPPRPDAPPLPAFELEDQHGAVVRGAELIGHPVVLIGADRRGREESVRWSKALGRALRSHPDAVDVRVLRVADLTSVPPPVRPVARRMVRDAYDIPLLLDWEGAFADTYGFASGLANVLVFAADGSLAERHSGPPPAEGRVSALVDRLLADVEASRRLNR